MEPKLPSPDRVPEFLTANSMHGGEESRFPDSESRLGHSVEQQEQRSEASPSTVERSSVPPVSQPTSVASLDDNNDTASASPATLPLVQSDMPATANDDELIEKEWVDKAKKVIADTKDDPYRREQEVSRLQADYLFKRYGRKLGSPQ